jgi:2-iminobutanoate/2-iminopropanoate deaminase
MSHHRETVSAEGAPAAVGPYSHAVKSNGFVFCSGQVPIDPETGKLIESDDAGDQVRRCLENLSIVAAAAGAQLADAVRMTVYLADIADWGAVNEVYAGYFSSEPPARVAFAVAALPLGARVEVDAVIALDE